MFDIFYPLWTIAVINNKCIIFDVFYLLWTIAVINNNALCLTSFIHCGQ